MDSVLVADSSEEFAATLTDALKDRCRIIHCTDGAAALEHLRTGGFRLLVTDTMLPELDGITLIESALKEGILPRVLVATLHRSPYILSRLNRLPVSYILCKPCRICALKDRILDLLDEPVSTVRDTRKAVTGLLISLGMQAKHRGYDCTREAILYLTENRQLSMTKELYPAVAERCSGNANQVEKAIRDAITKAWTTRDGQIWPQYFRPCADGTIPKPTNAEFLTRLAEAVSLEEM